MAGALVVANLRFTDKERYLRYAAAFPAVFATSGGQVLAADEEPKPFDGDGAGVDKIVILRFGSEDAARAFLNSPEYLRICEDRDAGAKLDSWIVRSF
ncbi:DUF1330 domain-containing protein [Sphingomonas sinipercae]|uniref:DUF1330 domain-containing protein n=1 Tax=Sphingomonas sinipercae TaxID=2714944 RepID=A0A6G7ZL64_9SPHN|nr:DUF1330 domain-containing protein [Sphingomonas sinipercae]QIL01665.1 DUF1330 domain-containing protein [Sphingomonas sinipercae]